MDERKELIATILEKNKCCNGFKGSLAYAEAYADGVYDHPSYLYAKGFYDGMSANQKYPQTLMVMGYNLEQILNLIDKDKYNKKDNNGLYCQIIGRGKRMVKMTREEAIKLAYKQFKYNIESDNLIFSSRGIVSLLEALDLIKFYDNEKPNGIMFKDVDNNYVEITKDEVIKTLSEAGYKPEDFIASKRKYVFFPNLDAGKDNVSVYQDDAIKTLKKYGYAIYDKEGNRL